MAKPASHLLEIYDCWLHLATTTKQWRKLRSEYECLTDEPNAAGSVNSFVDTQAKPQAHHLAIYIDRKVHANRALLVGTVAHEATHAACMILDHIEETPTGDTETRAYLVGWIATWIWDRI